MIALTILMNTERLNITVKIPVRVEKILVCKTKVISFNSPSRVLV